MYFTPKQAPITGSRRFMRARVGVEGERRARKAWLHVATDDMPVVLVGDLNV